MIRITARFDQQKFQFDHKIKQDFVARADSASKSDKGK